MGTGFIKHKPKKSDAKRAEHNMPQPKAKPAAVGKVKPANEPPACKSWDARADGHRPSGR